MTAVRTGRAATRADFPPDRIMGRNPSPLKVAPFPDEEATIAIRIQLGPMPTMLSEIVIQMLVGRDTFILGPSAPEADPLEAALAAGAQLLVVRSEPSLDGTIERIFAQPDLAILMISNDARQGRLVRLAQQPVTLDRETMSALVLDVAGHA